MKRRSFLAGLVALGVGSKLGPLPAPSTAVAVPAAPAAGVSVGPLTAPGGWCAPSETIYDLGQVVWRGYSGGILDLEFPEIKMQRGGIQFTFTEEL